MKNLRLAFSLAIAVSASTGPLTAENRVVLVSIDGLRADFYLEPEAHGAELPSFRAMVREGVYAEGVEGVYPTVTYPAHTTIVTGVRPGRHHVLNNTVFDEHGNSPDWYWHAESIRVPALWDVADGATAALHWPVTVGADIDYNFPEFWIPGSEAPWREVRRQVVTPKLFADVEAELGPFSDEALDEEPLEELVFSMAEIVIEKYRPALLLIHVFNTDTKQHRHGLEHREVSRAFEIVDEGLGRLRRKLAAFGLDDETLFVVTGDHGFIATHTIVHPNVALAEAGLVNVDADGGVVSWRAMVWPSGGSAALMVKSDTPEAEREARNVLEALASGPLSGAFRLVERAELDALSAMPDAVVGLEAREGYLFGANTRGELLTPSPSLGYHGYLPTHPKMRTGFLMVGPRVRRNLRVPILRQIDVAPTVAAWAGWKLEGVEGMALTGLFTEE